MTAAEKKKDGDIWDLLNEYADIRDELEDTMSTLSLLQTDIEEALEELDDELSEIQDHLKACSKRLYRFRGPSVRG